MELMSLLNQYNVPLTKTERAFFKGIGSAGASRTDAYYEQQVKRLADTREALKQLPDKKTSDRQSKVEKIKMLKDRLRMLKQMIPFMSASSAKSLRAELKQIAAQIGALKDSSGGIGGTEALTGSNTQVSTDTASSGKAEAAAAEATAEAAESSDTEQPGTGSDAGEAKNEASSDKGSNYLEQANQSKSESAADRADKEELEKLKQLFQSVKQMLERKLQKPNDPATQTALQMQAYQAAEEAIREAGVSIKG